jgi:heat-inducible transcriptional repressor
MRNKQSLILEYIIKEYIKSQEPIGSQSLKDVLEIKISSSSIRSYFKKLEDVGCLVQVHISSGRVPTTDALQKYWVDLLLPLNQIKVSNFEHLETIAQEESIFCVAKFLGSNKLKEVVNAKDRFLVLVFEDGEITTDYSLKIESFLMNLIDYEVFELKDICSAVGAINLSKKLDSLGSRVESAGVDELFEMYNREAIDKRDFFSLNSADAIDELSDGLSFHNDCMMVKQDAIIDNKRAKILSVGAISRNFFHFFNKVTKES